MILNVMMNGHEEQQCSGGVGDVAGVGEQQVTLMILPREVAVTYCTSPAISVDTTTILPKRAESCFELPSSLDAPYCSLILARQDLLIILLGSPPPPSFLGQAYQMLPQ